MKKLIYCAAALATALFAGSCQQELLDTPAGENTVTYTVEVPEVMTKAIGDGTNVNSLVYEVWKTDEAGERDLAEGKTGIRLYQKTIEFPMIDGRRKANVTLNLVKNQNYTVLFWAQNAEAGAYNTSNLTSVTYKNNYGPEDTQYFSNQEGYAAFYHAEFISETSPRSKRIELRRPFAQVNIATTNSTNDGDGAELYKIKMTSSKVTIKNVPTVFNVAGNISKATAKETGEQVTNGATPSTTTFVFDVAYLPNCTSAVDAVSTHNVAGQPYEYAAMNYIFANGTVDVTYEINTVLKAIGGSTSTTAKVVNTVYSVPVEENYRTNIVGNLLTSTTEYEVVVDAEWANEGNEPPYLVELWDGETISEPDYKAETKTYTVTNGSELAWLAAAVNGTLPVEDEVQAKSSTATKEANKFKGETFVLSQDINLDNHNWTPIGTKTHPFEGTFDGNGKVISNLVAHGGAASDIGLFGYTQGGEIKNVIIENANVSGRLNIGVVAGTPYTSKYTDITVKGHVEVNGMSYVGGVGGKNAYADWTNIKVEVDENSYVKAHSIENGTAYRSYVGGVVGFNGEGGHSFKNITSNIDVEGSTCDVGGLFGIAHYGNQFVNCSCSGDVEIYAAEESAEAEEIGGIAGVWHNENGTQVTFTDCSFTGNVTTNVERGTVWYNNLVGKPYGNGKGKLVIDGLEFDINGVNFEKINTILATGEGYVFPFDLTGDATASNGYGVTGITHKVGGTIDGNNATLKVNKATATWASALHTRGGLIKNLTVAKGFRGIFITGNESKVYLDNVVIEGPTYTISCDQGLNGGLEAKNSTFNGWTSYAATIGDVYFENCSFGQGAGYKFARPYAPTTFVDCDFCEGYQIDARAEVVFINCTINGVELTDIEDLVTSNAGNAKIYTEVSTSEEMVAALAAGENVSLTSNLTFSANDTPNTGYGKAGLNVSGSVLNGNRHTITANDAWATWDCTISAVSGTIKNATISGAMRGIFMPGANGDVYIDNITFANVIYTFNSDAGNKNYGVYISNSILNGWTSFSNVHKEVVFTNCSFGEGNGYAFCRPYNPCVFENCEFSTDMEFDTAYQEDIVFKNCTYGGVKITAENAASLKTGEKTFFYNGVRTVSFE